MTNRFTLLTICVLLIPLNVCAQPKKGKARPILRLDADGPTAQVTSLVFSPDGRTLYAGGFDKVVRVWHWDGSKFVHDKTATLRIPISAGLQGAVNALAVSDNGKWLAVGGFGASPELVGIGLSGRLFPTLGVETKKMKEDQGVVYVFNTATGKAKQLKGHTGNVTDLSFSPGKNDALVLFSVATPRRKPDQKKSEVIVWDVANSKKIAVLEDLPYVDNLPPKLAALSPLQVNGNPRAALALGDGKMRVWQVGQPKATVAKTADGSFNNVVATSRNPANFEQVVHTCSWGVKKSTGFVTSWDVRTNSPPEPPYLNMRPYSVEEKINNRVVKVTYVYQPRALAVSSNYYTAAIKDRNDRSGRFEKGKIHLWIINRKTRKTANFVTLWKDSGRAEVIATDPSGSFVAVAGDSGSQIYVFRMNDLIAKTKPAPQILRNNGRPAGRIVFSEKMIGGKNHLGLRVDHDENGKNNTLFDITGNTLHVNAKDWPTSKSDNKGWTRFDPTRFSVSVKSPEGKQVTLTWPKDKKGNPTRIVTYYDLVDKSPAKIPLLAVATKHVETGEPSIEIYHAGTGQQLRRFVGHVGDITSLAFSADGRLLASTSADHTLAVWSLTNLSSIYKKHGRLTGFAVAEDNNQLVLRKFTGIVDNSEPAAGLKDGMVIDEVENLKMKIETPKKPAEIYDRFWITKPDEFVTLRIGNQKLKVKAGQGIDVQPPLFQLFVTKHGKQQKLEWTLWTPMGDFDLSLQEVGKVLGWHFNTGDPKQPTRFAELSQYQPKEFKLFLPGIVKYLVKHGNRSDARKEYFGADKPKPPLKMAVFPGNQFVRAPRFRASLRIDHYQPNPGDTLVLEMLNANNWEVVQKFKPAADVATQVDLTKAGIYKYRFALKADKPHHSDVFAVRFQPPAPVITGPVVLFVDVKQKDYVAKAMVTPGAKNVAAKVVLQHYFRNALVKEYPFRVGKEEELKKQVTLMVGVNNFKWSAVNENALTDHKLDETAVPYSFAVNFKEPIPPSISLLSVVPFWKGQDFEKIDLPKNFDNRIVVSTPSIRVVGDIVAPAKLKTATWRIGAGKLQSVKNFVANANKIKILEEIPIEPGNQEIEFTAVGTDGKSITRRLHVRCQPKLPGIKFAGKPDDDVKKQQFTVQGKLLEPAILPRTPFPMTMTLFHNGAKGETIKIKSDDKAFQFDPVNLAPGSNSFQVQLGFLLETKTSSQSLIRRFLRPPTITELKYELNPKIKTLAKITAAIKSATPLRKEMTNLKIGTSRYQPQASDIKIEGGKGTYSMTINDIPLKEGGNDVVLTVHNQEDSSTGTVKVPVPIAPKNPKIVLAPGMEKELLITERTLEFPFKISSETALKWVHVIVDGKVVQKFDTKAIGDQTNKDIFEFNSILKFEPGTKRALVTLEARNEGGHVKLPDPIGVEIKLPPPGVQIAKVESYDEKQKKWVKAKPNKDNEFVNLPGGRVRIHGVARWNDVADIPPAKDQSLEIFVNDFRHLPTALNPGAAPTERTFTSELLLNSKTNAVKFELPSVAIDSQSSDISKQFTMTCNNPHTEKSYHVVLFAPKFEDQALLGKTSMELKSKIKKALGNVKVDKWYALTNDYYSANDLARQQFELQQNVYVQTAQGGKRPVVMFVYLGKQTATDDDVYLWTSYTDSKNVKRESIAVSKLKDYFSNELYGAQVVFMEAMPDGAPRDGWLTTQLRKEDVHFAAFGRWIDPDGTKELQPTRLIDEMEKTLPESQDFNQLQQRIERWSKMPPPPIFDQHVPKQLKIQFAS